MAARLMPAGSETRLGGVRGAAKLSKFSRLGAAADRAPLTGDPRRSRFRGAWCQFGRQGYGGIHR